MELEQQIAEACNISLDEAQNELDHERQYLFELMEDDDLSFEDMENACFSLGVEPSPENIASLLLY